MEDAIVVALRTEVGKSANRKLRKEGMIPATVYGLGENTVSLKISPKIVARIIASPTGMNSLIYLQREGTDIKRHVIIKAVQRDPVTSRLIHVDFMRIDPSRKVRVRVPICLVGTPIGTKEGGKVELVHRDIEVECLPKDIPANIEIEISHMRISDNLRLEEVNLPDTVVPLDPPQSVICIIQGQKVTAEGAAGAEEGAAATE